MFYKFFPPPRFLQMPAVGLDISDASVRFAELVESRRGLRIGRYGEWVIPSGVIESGEIKKPVELRAIFSDFKKKFSLDFVAVSLPEEKAYLFNQHLPAMKRSEIRGAIELSLEEHVPIKTGEAIFDYEILKENDMITHVGVSVLAESLVNGYTEAFAGTGITPVAFEIEAQSLARSVVPYGDRQVYMIVDFGKTRTGIAIVAGEAVQFTATIQVGGGTLTESISKNLNISYKEAESMKHEKGVLGGVGDENFSLAIMTTISILRDEISRHHSYWSAHEDEYGKPRPAIQKIFLCGGDSNLAGFIDYLAAGLPVPIALANVMVNVNSLERYVPEIGFNDSLRYATAIGLALRRPA
jgi:type IV pilus assembly protein PilM